MENLETSQSQLSYQVLLLELENRRLRETLRRHETQIKHLFDMLQESLDSNGNVRPCDR